MTTMAAVGHTSGVVLFNDMVGVADGKELLPVGSEEVIVKFADGVGMPTDSAVKPEPEGTVKFPNGGGKTMVTVGKKLVVALLEGAITPVPAVDDDA